MPVGLGVDIVEIERMERVLARTSSFVSKVFTDEERAYCESKGNAAARFAARFAAKEAVCKALGTGILAYGIGMKDVEVSHDRRGKPVAVLHGRAAELAQEQGITDIPLSISYTHAVVVANAVAITKAAEEDKERRRDVKAELASRFKEARSMLDELGSETAEAIEGCDRA